MEASSQQENMQVERLKTQAEAVQQQCSELEQKVRERMRSWCITGVWGVQVARLEDKQHRAGNAAPSLDVPGP